MRAQPAARARVRHLLPAVGPEAEDTPERGRAFRLAAARPPLLEGGHHSLARPGARTAYDLGVQLLERQLCIGECGVDGRDDGIGLLCVHSQVGWEVRRVERCAQDRVPHRKVGRRDEVDGAPRTEGLDQTPVFRERLTHGAPRAAFHPKTDRELGGRHDLGVRSAHDAHLACQVPRRHRPREAVSGEPQPPDLRPRQLADSPHTSSILRGLGG